MTNDDDFNRAIGLILDRLYQQRPREVFLDVTKLADAEEPNVKLMSSTVDFLLQEGFLRGHVVDDGHLMYRVTLSLKGLAVLNSVPQSLKGEPPLGQRLRTALKSGGREAVNAVISQVISTTLSGKLSL